jgi:hypothetical protein
MLHIVTKKTVFVKERVAHSPPKTHNSVSQFKLLLRDRRLTLSTSGREGVIVVDYTRERKETVQDRAKAPKDTRASRGNRSA